MNIGNADRNKIREAQRSLNRDPRNPVGNLIEYKTVDPRNYHPSARSKQSSESKGSNEIGVRYYPIYYNKEATKNKEDKELVGIKEINGIDLVTFGMDKVEFDKLEWMKRVNEINPNSPKFDEKGRVSKKDENAHDIESLSKLLDSSYNPQVNYALTVIGRIAELANVGYYDNCFSDNIHEILINECLLKARRHLDSTSETTWQNALRCIRSLICNTNFDEVVLDRIHPIVSQHPDTCLWLDEAATTTDFTSEMKDCECVKIDAVKALLERTRLLDRIVVLLSNEMDRANSENILDILIRLSRHSIGACLFLNRNDLLSRLETLFLPTEIDVQGRAAYNLTVKALKFIRILARATYEISDPGRPQYKCEVPLTIIDSIRAYFFIDFFSVSSFTGAGVMCQLHIEALRAVKTLFSLEKYVERIIKLVSEGKERLFKGLRALSSLDATKKLEEMKISPDWQYAAHVIDLIGSFAKYEYQNMTQSVLTHNSRSVWASVVKPIALKWLAHIINMRIIPHIDVSIAIATAAHHMKIVPDIDGTTDLENTAVGPLQKKPEQSHYFLLLVRAATESHNLSNYMTDNGQMRDPASLPSYGCLGLVSGSRYEIRISPPFNDLSPFVLMDMYLTEILPMQIRRSRFRMYIDNMDVVRYIQTSLNYVHLPMTYDRKIHGSFLAQFEVRMMCRLTSLIGSYYLGTHNQEQEINAGPPKAKKGLLESYDNICHYAVSIIGLLNAGSETIGRLKDEIFEKVLLHPNLSQELKVESTRKRFPLVDYEEASEPDVISHNHLEVLVPLYASYYQQDRYWLLQPIADYYQNQIKYVAEGKKKHQTSWFQKNVDWRTITGPLVSSTDVDIMRCLLQFYRRILLCSHTYTHSFIIPNVEEFLCILGCMFLDEELFHDERLSLTLSEIIKVLLKECITSSNGLSEVPFTDASRVIVNLDLPLADFFQKLVDQYESVSYGNVVFSNFILLFLTSEADNTFKRLFYQDKAESCLRTFRLTMDEVFIPKELFATKVADPEVREMMGRVRSMLAKDSYLAKYCEAQCYWS